MGWIGHQPLKLGIDEAVATSGIPEHDHPMIETSFPAGDETFLDDKAAINALGLVQSWFDEHEDEVKHLPWPTKSPNLSVSELLWDVLER
ncbi:DDE_3 domain-containing protein [Trichonephila clavipes]|nr:DDE_3 domain-containing protein [Trichonephila clavipes]